MNILQYLSENTNSTAHEIAKALQEEKTRVNRVLYLLEGIITVKNVEHQWSTNGNIQIN